MCVFGEDGEHLYTIGPLSSKIRSIEWKSENELSVNIGSAICMITVTETSYEPGLQYEVDDDDVELTVHACAPHGKILVAGCSNGLVSLIF